MMTGGSFAHAMMQEPLAPSLAELHDIVVADPVSWMPATIGWAILGGLLALATLTLGWRAWRRWQANAYRRAALAELATLRARAADRAAVTTLGEVSAVLKRAALVAFPRDRVAALSGPRWTAFLNGTCSRAPFSEAAGRALGEGEYAAATSTTGDLIETIFESAGLWIRQHRPESH